MNTGTKPPRGAVVVTTEVKRGGVVTRHVATCSACDWSYSNSVRSDVEQHKRWHLCTDRPASTEGTAHAEAQ